MSDVTDDDEKNIALEAFTNALIPGRWEDVRPPTAQELRATSVLRMSLEEASVKTRSGPPGDDPADLDLDAWAGVIPLELRALPAVADPKLRVDIATPAVIANYVVRDRPQPKSVSDHDH